jgi:hypothetical protein
MFLRWAEAETGGMELRLWVDGDDPVSGRLGVNDQGAVAFVGWLGLLSVLEKLVASGSAQAPGDGPGGQLGARGHPKLGEDM